MTSKHCTRLVKTPWLVEIDKDIAELIQTLWAAGIRTTYCCQGDDVEPLAAYIPATSLAYITFGSREEALLFVAAAGPFAWPPSQRPFKDKKADWHGIMWTHWHLESATVCFPKHDIPRALTALRVNFAVVQRLARARAGAPQLPPRELRGCVQCGRLIDPNRRADAKYCSRACQEKAARLRKKLTKRGPAGG